MNKFNLFTNQVAHFVNYMENLNVINFVYNNKKRVSHLKHNKIVCLFLLNEEKPQIR
jgi:hypothetical protein